MFLVIKTKDGETSVQPCKEWKQVVPHLSAPIERITVKENGQQVVAIRKQPK